MVLERHYCPKTDFDGSGTDKCSMRLITAVGISLLLLTHNCFVLTLERIDTDTSPFGGYLEVLLLSFVIWCTLATVPFVKPVTFLITPYLLYHSLRCLIVYRKSIIQLTPALHVCVVCQCS